MNVTIYTIPCCSRNVCVRNRIIFRLSYFCYVLMRQRRTRFIDRIVNERRVHQLLIRTKSRDWCIDGWNLREKKISVAVVRVIDIKAVNTLSVHRMLNVGLQEPSSEYRSIVGGDRMRQNASNKITDSAVRSERRERRVDEWSAFSGDSQYHKISWRQINIVKQ